MTPFAAKLDTLLEKSEFLNRIQSFKRQKEQIQSQYRPLTQDEIAQLVAQGNHAEAWNNITVAPAFTPHAILNSIFIGNCQLGRFGDAVLTPKNSTSLPVGIYNSLIGNTAIGDYCAVWHVKEIANYAIGPHCQLHNIGSVACAPVTAFGNGTPIALGVETGGREVVSFAEITIPLANTVATHKADKSFCSAYATFCRTYTERATLPQGVIEANCNIRNTASIRDAFIGTGANIDGAQLIENCTLLCTPDEPVTISHGAYMRHTLAQWGVVVTSSAIVDTAILTEYSHIERHGKVTHAIIGPNTGIAEGEVTASLVGPFVGFHHQSLLIGAIWPEGKGNVAYGANVGSNHTAKAPDQEIRPGEGTFFGLGVNIKFPADFSASPYSIIATGVTTLPQRILFPFSLMSTPLKPFDGISPAFNVLFPGWVLTHNLYMILRSEAKFTERNRARRIPIVTDVFRPDIIDLMMQARALLLAAATEPPRDYYLSSQIDGIGKNVLTETGRLDGIAAYTHYIRYYALKGLLQQIQEQIATTHHMPDAELYAQTSMNSLWEHQRSVLHHEALDRISLADNLTALATMEQQIALEMQKSKTRDATRGAKIMHDYNEVHQPAKDDPFVKTRFNHAATVCSTINNLMLQLR